MNGLLGQYESTMNDSYGDGTRRGRRSKKVKHVSDEDDHYMIFDAVQNAEMRD